MASKRTSRKRRRQRRGAGAAGPRVEAPAREAAARGDGTEAVPPEARAAPDGMARGYSSSRAKDEQARAALEPLRPGERPLAVTIGAVAAALLALANLVALAFGYNAGEDTLSPGSEASGSVIAAAVLLIVAYGMWKAAYWGVLGMQTLLALTIIFASLSLVTANEVWAALLLVLILAAAGTLFWFLIKAMARIQMPERPGQRTS